MVHEGTYTYSYLLYKYKSPIQSYQSLHSLNLFCLTGEVTVLEIVPVPQTFQSIFYTVLLPLIRMSPLTLFVYFWVNYLLVC